MSEQPPTVDQADRPGGSGHPEIDELASYAAGDLDAGGFDVVAAHLADCPDCSADVAALERVSAQLAELPDVAMPPDVAARLTAAIERATTGVPVAANVLPDRAGRRRTSGWASGAAAAAVIALVAAIAVGSINSNRSNSKTSATTAASTAAKTGRVYASGTDYSKAALTRQIGAVLSQPARDNFSNKQLDQAAGAAAAAGSAAAESSSAAAPAAAAAPATAAAPAASSAAASSAPAASGFAAAETASAAASSSAAAGLKAADSSAAASAPAADGAAPTAPPVAPVPAADLSALGADPARLARCVQSVTDGLTQPIAIDFASFEGQPALAIVLPTSTAGVREVYLVGGECGATDDAKVLYFARLAD